MDERKRKRAEPQHWDHGSPGHQQLIAAASAADRGLVHPLAEQAIATAILRAKEAL
jgi:hypothetical protein